MKKIDFNDSWIFKKADESEFSPVLIPHDAMIHEKRDPNSPGGGGHGYFIGGKYIYQKEFLAPKDWKDKIILLEFEGIYRNSTVYINGDVATTHNYGYTSFTVELGSFLNYGEQNTITVTVDNSELPNSRWYSGSGIYRPVNLYIGEKTCIDYQGIRIRTISINPAVIEITTRLRNEIPKEVTEVIVEIYDPDGEKVHESKGCSCKIQLSNARLWSEENPNLYTCQVKVKKENTIIDEVKEKFGIRTISWSTKGFFVNGNETLLRGGCIHHDNGILGAATWEKSEERRVRILKENGFNAIRMSHNPASEALLRACDKYGMYLMDETFDMWYARKTKYDYGRDFKSCWRDDVRAMVERDYNHPSVVMYSIGNEVSEPGKPEGVEQGKELIRFVKNMDSDRAITAGMNLMIMANYAKGKGQYDNIDQEEKNVASDKKDAKEVKNASLAFNMIAAMVGPGMNKAGNSKKVDRLTTPILDALDIAGYNYASGRYPLEAKAHPDRIIVGSETFPQDIYKNWEMVEKYPYLIGDFMWTAWDYLGEAGIGVWSYTGGMPFNRPYPYILGGAGVIDIIGNSDVSCRNAQIVWKKLSNPVIGVRPANHPGVRVSKSVWRGSNAIESWSWQGCDGNKTQVEVYTLDSSVELFFNGKSIGRKKTKKGKAVFSVKYNSGTLAAASYDANGKKTGFSELKSSEGALHLTLKPEETEISVGDIAYVPITICDANGVIESNADQKITVHVEGGTLLAFGSATPLTEESYDTGSFTTYYGKALAVVHADNPGTLSVSASAEGFDTVKASIYVN